MKSLFILWVFLLFACSWMDRAGTTSETENEVVALVQLPSGKPAVQAKVYLMDMDHEDSLVSIGKSPQIDSAFTDEKGRCILRKPTTLRNWKMLALQDSLIGLTEDSLVQIQASGTFQGYATPGERIAILGTGLYTIADAKGFFRFPLVPPGEYPIIHSGSQGVGFEGSLQIVANEVVVENISAGILVDDFDDGDAFPLLQKMGAGSAWYFYTEQGGTQFYPPQVMDTPSFAMGVENAWEGNSLTLKMFLDTTHAAPYGSVACKIGPQLGSQTVNLLDLDSITFMARGAGQFRILLATDKIHAEYPISESGSDLGYTFTTTTAWTRIRVPVDSLLPPVGSAPAADGIEWVDVGDRTDLLVFGSWDDPGDTLLLQVDDIRLHGISFTPFR